LILREVEEPFSKRFPAIQRGIFDSSSKLKADRKFQPQAYERIPRIEISDQRGDWANWDVLKLAQKTDFQKKDDKMAISKKIEAALIKSSWIRKMFEEGARLKAIHGDENVFDFTLGNPNLPPPDRFKTALLDTVQNLEACSHGYMPNSGYPFARKAIADQVSSERGMDVAADDIVITVGAAGALNVVLKSVLNAGEEVVVPTPYFVEYGFYIDNHGGVLKTVPTRPDFTLDLDAISGALTEKTRAVLINFPNNPTGQVYSQESLDDLGRLLKEKSDAFGSPIYLVSDEPYRKLVFDGIVPADIFRSYDDCVVVTSYSKDISIPGERLGYAAVNPRTTEKKALLDAMIFANRTLGFVNAPALIQRVVCAVQGESADMAAYARKRDLICDGLADAGYEFTAPRGTFYVFPRTPIPDDVAFVNALQEELILVVPGSGFGGPGHFRIAFCVDDDTIVKALPAFKKVMEAAKKK
jgi:aspartate aminotransferase